VKVANHFCTTDDDYRILDPWWLKSIVWSRIVPFEVPFGIIPLRLVSIHGRLVIKSVDRQAHQAHRVFEWCAVNRVQIPLTMLHVPIG
jgi:hypothetical protein